MKPKNGNHSSSSDSFVPIEPQNYPLLLRILKTRLPVSGHMYNTALVLETFPQDMKAYSLFGTFNDDSIFTIIFSRDDWGQDINISIPNEFHVTEEIKKAFISTSAIDWRGKHFFTAVDRRISIMIFEINVMVYRNSISFNPNYTMYLDVEEALKITIEPPINDVKVKSLEMDSAPAFFMSTWRYASPGSESYLCKIIKHHITSGIYVNEELVTGAVVNGHGLIGILNTAKEHQKKGYATLCMKHLMLQMAQKGFLPVSSLQQENTLSLKLHEKLGMKISHETDYILHIPYLKSD